jgi:hypothetical protein
MIDYRLVIQSRDGIKQLIDNNPENIVILRKPLKDNGFDMLVEDPFGVPVPTSIRCRISKEARGPETYVPTAAGLKISETFYILVEHDVQIFVNDKFEARDRNWRIGPVSQIKSHGGIIAYEAPLIEATTIQGSDT